TATSKSNALISGPISGPISGFRKAGVSRSGVATPKVSIPTSTFALLMARPSSSIPFSLNNPDCRRAQGKLRKDLTPISQAPEEGTMGEAFGNDEGVARLQAQRGEPSVPQARHRLPTQNPAVSPNQKHAVPVGVPGRPAGPFQ